MKKSLVLLTPQNSCKKSTGLGVADTPGGCVAGKGRWGRVLRLGILLSGLLGGTLFAEVPPPVITPMDADSVLAFDVEITGAAGTVTHYTTSGANPTQEDLDVGEGGSVRIVTNTELKARSFNGSGEASQIASANYEVTGAIFTGEQHTLLLTSSGKLFSWGNGATGKLGNGGTTNQANPVEVLKGGGNFEDAVDASAGSAHSLAVDAAGFVWAFGNGANYRLGNNATANKPSPVQVLKGPTATDYLEGIVQVAAADLSSYALDDQKRVWGWGNRANGRLGEGSTSGNQQFAIPVTRNLSGFPQLSGIQKIAAAAKTALALGEDELVYGWGYNGNGQLGQGNTNNNITRAEVVRLDASTNLTGATDISVGSEHIAVVRWTTGQPGTVWSAGTRDYGRLGNGTSTSGSESYPVRAIKIDGQPLTGIIQVAAGFRHTLALDEEGQVWSWGFNNRGQLGDGTTTNRNYADLVRIAVGGDPLEDIVYVAAMGTALYSTSFAIRRDGQIFAWGANNQRQFGNGQTNTTNPLPVYAGNGKFGSIPPPTISLSVSGPPYITPANVTLTASVTAPRSSVAKVDFYHNGSLAHTDTTSPYQCQLTVLGAGEHKFHAVITNAEGGMKASNEVSITATVPTVSVAVINSPVFETSATPAKFRISRGPTYNGALTVFFDLAGTAVAGTHYQTIAPLSSTIPAGIVSVDIDIQPIAQLEEEEDKTVVMTLSPSSDYTIAADQGTVTIVNVPRATVPTVWPPPESMVDVRIIKFSCETAGAAIHYTTDGTAPTTASPLIPPGELVRVPRNTTVRAIAVASGYQQSAELSASYSGRAQIHAGEDFSAAISQEGDIYTWGSSNANGQLGKEHTLQEHFPFRIEGQSGVVSASAGLNHLVFSKENGTSFASGFNADGRLGIGSTGGNYSTPTQVSGTNQFAEVSVNQAHSLAITDNGTVFGWGSKADGRLANAGSSGMFTEPTQIATNYRTVVAGVTHSLGIDSDGKVVGWGSNGNYQLGIGNTTTQLTPVVGKRSSTINMDGVVQVSAGDRYSLALSKNGTVWSVGLNDDRRTGRTNSVNYFTQISNLTEVVKISAGYSHALALKADGTVFGWGSNAEKKINSSGSTSISSPLQLAGITNAVDISAGRNHSLILLADGSVIMLGKDSRPNPINLATKASMPTVSHVSGHHTAPIAVTVTSTQPEATLYFTLDGTEPTEESPTVASGGTVAISSPSVLKVKAFAPGMGSSSTVFRSYSIGGRIFAGRNSTILVDNQGRAWAFGWNSNGMLGLGNSQSQNTPQQISSLTDVREVAFGAEHTLFLLGDGTVYAAGYNSYGSLGNNSTTSSNVPVPVSGLSGVVAIAASDYHSLALKNDGTLVAWGYNGLYQIGDGTNANRTTPVSVQGLSDIIAIASGNGCSMALKADGELYVWGYSHAALGLGSNPGASTFPTPIRCGSISDLVAFSLSYYHVLGIRRDGDLWGVGDNRRRQLTAQTVNDHFYFTPIPGMTDIIACSAGTEHSLAVDNERRIWGFGRMDNGRLGVGMYGPGNLTTDNGFGGQNQQIPAQTQLLPAAFAVSAGGSHSAATAWNGTTTHWVWGAGWYGQIGVGDTAHRYLPVIIGAGSNLDTDGNGLPDWWEYTYFGSLNQNATGDPDGDGLINLYEYLLGFDPLLTDTDGNGYSDFYDALMNPDHPYYPSEWNSDTDGDGLSDGWEIYFGSDPNNPDTNGNGMSDGLAHLLGISLTNLDSDGDGISNADEIAMGTNPFLADTDGDGVNDGDDAFPLDSSRWEMPEPSPGDATPPGILLFQPAGAVLQVP